MGRHEKGSSANLDRIQVEMLGILREPVPGQQWFSTRQHKIWSPPTDVYETDTCIIVKVEIAGMEEQDFSISLDTQTLLISGIRHDPAAKLGYQQMEILYGQFETQAHLPGAIDADAIEATYQNGFLHVRLPKTMPRQVPVTGTENSS